MTQPSPIAAHAPVTHRMLCQSEMPTLLNALPDQSPRTYPKGDHIYTGGPDAFCYVINGFVQVYRPVPGHGRMSIGIYGPGRFFGEGAFASKSNELAIALSGAVVTRWNPLEVGEVMELHPEYYQSLLIERAEALAERLTEQWYPVRVRLAMALLRLNRTIGCDGRVLDAPRRLPHLTHDVLAQEVCTSRELVTNAMRRYAQDKRVLYNRRDGIGLWPKRLQEVAHVSA